MSRTLFIFYHIWWGFIAGIWYYNLLFCCIRGMSLRNSRIVLVLTVTLSIIILTFLQLKRNRNSLAIAADLTAGYGLYTIAAYHDKYPGLIFVTFTASLVLSLFYFILIMFRRIQAEKHKNVIIRFRLKNTLTGCRNILCAGFAVMMLLAGLNSFFLISPQGKKDAGAENKVPEEQTIAANMETLILLSDENWNALNEEEKLQVLQTIANIERHYLGLPHELTVRVSDTEEDKLCGYYYDRTHEITINRTHLMADPSYALVDTIAHEAYHALQHRMVEAYEEADEEAKNLILFYDASVYSEELRNYKNGSEDFRDYYSQKCEEDARNYAKTATEEYFRRISEGM